MSELPGNNLVESTNPPEREAIILRIKSQIDQIEQELFSKINGMTLDGNSTVVNNLKVRFNRQTGEIVSGQYMRLTADQPSEAEEAPNEDPSLAVGYLKYEIKVPNNKMILEGIEFSLSVTDFSPEKFVGPSFTIARRTEDGYEAQASVSQMNEPTPTALDNIRRAIELRKK